MGLHDPKLAQTVPGDRGLHSDVLTPLIHGRLKYPRSTLLASSTGRGWSMIAAELREQPAGRIGSPEQHTVEVAIGIRGGEDGFIVRTNAGQQAPWSEGSVWIAPIGVDEEEVVATTPIPRVLHLYLPIRQFSMLADQYNLPRTPVHSMQYIGGFADELIRQIGLSLLAEIADETATGLMLAETASLMLTTRLCQAYCDGNFAKLGVDTPHRLDNTRLRRVLDYIEQHLDEDMTVARLADLANLSAFHFTRMFTAAVGVSPCRHVSRRRLDKAMTMLAVGKLPLCEIALRSQFSSQASFSRAFRRVTGVTPGEYRRRVR